MPPIMADHDIEGHLQVLLQLLKSEEWHALWNELTYNIESFESLGITYNTSDLDLWRLCQERQIVLITANRNITGPESLESPLQQVNAPSRLPVLTIAAPNHILSNRDYAQQVVNRLLEYLIDADNVRGTGRLYLPDSKETPFTISRGSQ